MFIPDPAAVFIPENARWWLQLPAIDVQLWGWNAYQMTVATGRPRAGASPQIVFPGGQPLLFTAEFNGVGGVPNVMDGWLTGFSFPKGNVLSGF